MVGAHRDAKGERCGPLMDVARTHGDHDRIRCAARPTNPVSIAACIATKPTHRTTWNNDWASATQTQTQTHSVRAPPTILCQWMAKRYATSIIGMDHRPAPKQRGHGAF
ncbi:hypothetical protein BHM03_00048397 [Ensete ventricosum]|uniref:Uncharacterized protein n=1 Tax=Ensete ventricosum TaxID=4639 RepID=A0A445MLF7_ENSVE|nr:hypothetical protein BHM03_00048397 [Ensete ventricosum]